jgi:hypothetical protein
MDNSSLDSDLGLSSRRGGEKKYPSPFFDLAQNYMPKNIKELFKYCRTYYQTDTFLSNIVGKLAQYPITEILISSVDNSTTDIAIRKSWLTLFKKFHLSRVLIEVGLDYHIYGNSFITFSVIKKRFLRNPLTGEEIPFNEAKFKWKNFKFYVTNSKGSNGMTQPEHDVAWEIVDSDIVSEDSIKIIRWNPEDIDIVYNPTTGKSTYYYNIPTELKSAIISGNSAILEDIPPIYIEAVKSKQAIRFKPNSIYHFKRPGAAQANMGWGIPMILPAIKKIYYLQTLQRGNEAIANDHIVPKKSVSPASTGAIDPLSQINMSKWKGEITETVKKWRQDPNHIAVFPIPVQYQELGGNAKGLMVTQEMEFLEQIIINSLGVPIEFIKGGASWTGSSVSLRIVENMFVTYREQLEEFLNLFTVPFLATALKLPIVEVSLKKLKMSDDVQSKQLLFELAAANIISRQRLLDEFGYDAEAEMEQIGRETVANSELEIIRQRNLATAQGEAQVILQKLQTKANFESSIEEVRLRIQRVEQDLMAEHGSLTTDPVNLIEQLAMNLLYTDPIEQEASLARMGKTMPITQSLVIERMQALQQIYAAQQSQSSSTTSKSQNAKGGKAAGNKSGKVKDSDKKSNAQKDKGTREGDKVAVSDKEKTRANSRGEPNG